MLPPSALWCTACSHAHHNTKCSRGKFRDQKSNHEIHENIVSRKFGVIPYFLLPPTDTYINTFSHVNIIRYWLGCSYNSVALFIVIYGRTKSAITLNWKFKKFESNFIIFSPNVHEIVLHRAPNIINLHSSPCARMHSRSKVISLSICCCHCQHQISRFRH